MAATDLKEGLIVFQKSKKRRFFGTIDHSFRLYLSREHWFSVLLRKMCSGVGPSGRVAFLFGEEIQRQFILIDFDYVMAFGFTESSSLSSAIQRDSIGEV